jgi:hypothetical protein
MKRLMNKLQNAQSKYDGVIGSVEYEIFYKVEFDFSILHQASDGWVMLAEIEGDSKNAGLDDLLEVIKQKGVLTEDDYMKYSI